MFNERHEKLLKDAFAFKELVGGAERLCEAGWRSEDAMDGDYMEQIEDFLLKWLPEEYENMCILKVDDCLEAEDKLTKFFKEEILEIMHR